MIKRIAVIGLGYVGLPLALLADKKNFIVYGLDIDNSKISLLASGKSYIDGITDKEIKKTKIVFTDNFSEVSKVEAVVICVPTPVDEKKMPDLRPVKKAVAEIAKHIRKKTIVIIESTVNPGVCEEVLKPILENSGKKVDKDFYLAHCPERINPGDSKWNVSNINRVIGASSKRGLEMAVGFYKKLIDAKVKPMGSIKEAEAVKIMENSFRDINIAFVNELAMSFHKLGINIENVIDGAATKPFSFIPHHPGCGVGGHCIPVDPYYLIEYARNNGFEHQFLTLARKINESMPRYTVDLLFEALNKIDMPVKGAKVAMLGWSYKADIGDDRESPAKVIKKFLLGAGVRLTVYDPYSLEKSNVSNLAEALDKVDAVLIATGHNEFKRIDPKSLKSNKIKIVIDGRNIYREKKDMFQSLGITYLGIGI